MSFEVIVSMSTKITVTPTCCQISTTLHGVTFHNIVLVSSDLHTVYWDTSLPNPCKLSPLVWHDRAPKHLNTTSITSTFANTLWRLVWMPWPDKQCLITATSQCSVPLNIHGHIATTLGLILHQPHGFTPCLQIAGLHTDFLHKLFKPLLIVRSVPAIQD